MVFPEVQEWEQVTEFTNGGEGGEWGALAWVFLLKCHRAVNMNCSQRAVRFLWGWNLLAVFISLSLTHYPSLGVELQESDLLPWWHCVPLLWAPVTPSGLSVGGHSPGSKLGGPESPGACCLSHSPFHSPLTFYNTFINACPRLDPVGSAQMQPPWLLAPQSL